MSARKLSLLLVLSVLVFPAAAAGGAYFVFDGPAVAYVGEPFSITVWIAGDTPGAGEPSEICGYATYIGYEDAILEMVDYQIEYFFNPSPSAFGFPVIYTPIGTEDPLGLSAGSLPGRFGSMDLVGDPDCYLDGVDPESCDAVGYPFLRPTATYTFLPLEEGTVRLFCPEEPDCDNGACVNQIYGCGLDGEDDPDIEPPIDIEIEIRRRAPVPTLGHYGMAFLMLAMAGGALRVIRKKMP